jgi:hypothetical protein
MVSRDLFALRVVGIKIRCDVRERVARNSSMRRCAVPRPTPLGRLRLPVSRALFYCVARFEVGEREIG